jgi:hypothetical protein
LARGVQKHHILAKSPCRKLSPTFRQKNRCQFPSTFFVLSSFRVFFSDGISKTLQRTCYKKNRVEKFLQKFDQKSKTDFFSIFL